MPINADFLNTFGPLDENQLERQQRSPMSKYKVRVRGDIPWRGEKRCFMEISVGQEYHEGEKLLATVRWVSKHFPQAHIVMGDTLHRHRLSVSTRLRP